MFQYIRQHNTVAFAISVCIACNVLAFFSYPVIIYYLVLFLASGYVFFKATRITFCILSLLIGCALSILFNNIPSLFHAESRFIYFSLLLIVASPLLTSQSLTNLRQNMFIWMIWLSLLIGTGSLLAYFLGINLARNDIDFAFAVNAGSFGGITLHSMLMGPFAGIGMCYMLWGILSQKIAAQKVEYWKYIILACCIATTLLSSSRAANMATLAGAISIVFFLFRKRQSKLVKYAFIASISVFISLPLMEVFSEGLVNKQIGNENMGSITASRNKAWQTRIHEFSNSPIVGIGFSSQTVSKDSGAINLLPGKIEPGTSWGAVFSMTGLVGGLSFVCIVLISLSKVWQMVKKEDNWSSFLGGVLIIFLFHFIAEGYIFAGGSPLNFMFWLCVGVIFSLERYKLQPASIPFFN